MTLHFNGKKDAHMREYVETLPRKPIDPLAEPFAAYRKTTITYAARVSVPFTVATMEGNVVGKAGDYLAIGIYGEMYPIDAAVFAESYEPVDQPSPIISLDENVPATVESADR